MIFVTLTLKPNKLKQYAIPSLYGYGLRDGGEKEEVLEGVMRGGEGGRKAKTKGGRDGQMDGWKPKKREGQKMERREVDTNASTLFFTRPSLFKYRLPV